MKQHQVNRQQLSMFPAELAPIYEILFPSTRFQGSKRKLVQWISSSLSPLDFDTVLDVFGGTGVVSHTFKRMGKQVTYNDLLAFNWNIGLALIENTHVTLLPKDIDMVLSRQDIYYPNFIRKTFQNIYFTDDENIWLDQVTYNIDHFLHDPIKQALARFALFQACIIKRPYNLFHRANLYMRQAAVKRSFGNKTTWDTPFEAHFRAFVQEANTAVFDNKRANLALNLDALETPTGYDLVYLDPPYLNADGVGVDYRDFYHFLEGLVDYENWPGKIDYSSKHRRLLPQVSPWSRADSIVNEFERVIARHKNSILVVSYRDDGIPSRTQLIDLLRVHKKTIMEAEKPQKYVLSKHDSHELLLIAT